MVGRFVTDIRGSSLLRDVIRVCVGRLVVSHPQHRRSEAELGARMSGRSDDRPKLQRLLVVYVGRYEAGRNDQRDPVAHQFLELCFFGWRVSIILLAGLER